MSPNDIAEGHTIADEIHFCPPSIFTLNSLLITFLMQNSFISFFQEINFVPAEIEIENILTVIRRVKRTASAVTTVSKYSIRSVIGANRNKHNHLFECRVSRKRNKN